MKTSMAGLHAREAARRASDLWARGMEAVEAELKAIEGRLSRLADLARDPR